MDNDTLENGKRKRKTKNGKKKSKHAKKDAPSTDLDPHEVIVHFANEINTDPYFLQ